MTKRDKRIEIQVSPTGGRSVRVLDILRYPTAQAEIRLFCQVLASRRNRHQGKKGR